MEVFNESGLYVIAGVKGVGKTSYLFFIGEQLRQKDSQKQTLYFYHSDAKMNHPKSQERIKSVDISELPMQTGHFFLEAQWAKTDYGLSAVMIDDFRYLLRTERFCGIELSRKEKILYLLTRLKTLSEVYDVPVIVTCSVDDDYIYGRLDKRPKLSDISNHEYVKAFSDKIILMHREELFCLESEGDGITEFIVHSSSEKECHVYRLAFITECEKYCDIGKK